MLRAGGPAPRLTTPPLPVCVCALLCFAGTATSISFAPFSATQPTLNLVVEEAINEALENDNMALQNLSSSKARRRGAAWCNSPSRPVAPPPSA